MRRASVLGNAVVAAAAAIGCGSGVGIGGVAQPQFLEVEAWLTCDECVHGEREAVRRIGVRGAPLLESALRELPPSLLQVLEWQVLSDYRYVARAVSDSAAFVDRLLAARISTIQIRSAIALGDLGAREVLQEALDSAAARRYSPEVERALRRALYRATDTARVRQVDAGTASTCALTTSGDVYCWGANGDGQLGDGDIISRATSAPLRLSVPVRSLNQSVGAHRCGMAESGVIYCWGNNDRGQVGPSPPDDQLTPRSQTLGRGPGPRPEMRSVRTGGFHTCADSVGGRLFCWGANDAGQLGDGTTSSRSAWRAVQSDSAFATFALGGAHTCALTASGYAYCWGSNATGQLGTGPGPPRRVPQPVSGSLRFDSVTAGISHTCAVTGTGQTYCWGLNASGQLGDSTTVTRRVPTRVRGGLQFHSLTAGLAHTCGLVAGGVAYCWGANSDGQLGNGSTAPSAVPRAVATPLRFLSLSAGGAHTCGISTDHLVYCWGRNDSGQLGAVSLSPFQPTPTATTWSLALPP